MKAMTIFAMSIRYLRDHLLDCLGKQATGMLETDIQYVLTVPAIWNDGAKQFMREAAIEAGIDTKRLKIALEPEAASIWCQAITEEAKLSLSSTGNQYMVVDLGGGTADISVHEFKEDGTLTEIHKASGGPWGGTEVDNNYLNMLTNLVGEKVMKRFKETEMGDYFDILREFETKKRTIHKAHGNITFRLSTSLKKIYEDDGQKFTNAVSSSKLSSSLKFARDKLRIDACVVKGWFEAPIKSLVNHVKSLLGESALKNVDTIVLVGGFGECQLVIDEFKSKLQNKRIIVPNEAGLAVLKGAVKFGHTPTIIATRILKCTYGRSGFIDFNPAIHPPQKLEIREDGQHRIGGCFKAIARIGDSVDIGHNITITCKPFSASLAQSAIRLFSTDAAYPKFVTDPGCHRLGELIIHYQKGKTLEEKVHDVTYIFGDTELLVISKSRKTGREFKTTVDCL